VGAHRGDGAAETRGVRGESQIVEGPSVGGAQYEGGGCGGGSPIDSGNVAVAPAWRRLWHVWLRKSKREREN
jgi:hypothetical protein